jgi:hypothetical protein
MDSKLQKTNSIIFCKISKEFKVVSRKQLYILELFHRFTSTTKEQRRKCVGKGRFLLVLLESSNNVLTYYSEDK